jgi:integrase
MAPGLTVGQVRIYAEDGGADGGAGETSSGEVYLNDTKTTSRARTVPLTDGLCRALLPLCVGKDPEEQVFSLSYAQVDVRWRRVRERAGLPALRIKDLRAQTAIAAETAGVPQTVVVATMGHSDEAMTRRYQRRRAVMTGEHAAAIERELGLTGS